MLTHTPSDQVSDSGMPPAAIDRRLEQRTPVQADLWMIDHLGSTILHCQCVDVSESGMRLRVPLGYGVSESQRYEIRSENFASDQGVTDRFLGVDVRRRSWVTVVRARVAFDQLEDYLDVGVVMEPTDTADLVTPFTGMV